MKQHDHDLVSLVAEIGAATGPIEGHLHALATERQLPDLAIAICTARIEEAAPALRAVLARAADGERLSDDDAMLAFRGLHILGAARDEATCPLLLRLLRRPIDEIVHLFGDTVTESLARIVAGVFDGDIDALFSAITDSAIDEFIREALFGAAAFHTWQKNIPHDRMHRLLERFYDDRLATDADYAWIGWLETIALLGQRNLTPRVYRAWKDGQVPLGVLDRHHFESDLADAERAPDDPARFKRIGLGYIDDVVAELDWTRLEQEWEDEPHRQSSWADFLPSSPAVNPLRHVGRNDPCPCGSGKKAKHCCLAT